jgi:hypothetical protein
MNENDSSRCLKTDRQQQLDLAIEFIAKYGDNIINYSLGKYCLCGCFDTIRVYATYMVNNVLNKDVLHMKVSDENYGTARRPKIRYVPWILGRRSGVDEFYLVGMGTSHEVFKLTSSADSPLCSVLAAEGIIDNVINLDWSGLSQVGGNPKT